MTASSLLPSAVIEKVGRTRALSVEVTAEQFCYYYTMLVYHGVHTPCYYTRKKIIGVSFYVVVLCWACDCFGTASRSGGLSPPSPLGTCYVVASAFLMMPEPWHNGNVGQVVFAGEREGGELGHSGGRQIIFCNGVPCSALSLYPPLSHPPVLKAIMRSDAFFPRPDPTTAAPICPFGQMSNAQSRP